MPKFVTKADGTIEQIKNCDDCLFKKEWKKIGKLISVILKKQTEQEPKTIQEKQAESEKYQKAYDDGYDNGYAQARFDYEQEPCEDEYIKVPKKALKYRTAGMVAYNAEWLKNHFDIERAVICGTQETKYCDRNICVSNEYNGIGCDECEVTKSQEPKIGHWVSLTSGKPSRIRSDGMTTESVKCSECGEWLTASDEYVCKGNYCPNCGARMDGDEE